MWKPAKPQEPANPNVKSGGKKRVTPPPWANASECQVVYNSDLIIRDPGEAATLCVFYDRVFLPFTDDQSAGGLIDTRTQDAKLDLVYGQTDEIRNWELTYGTLFDEGVLSRVSPQADDKVEEWQTVRIWQISFDQRAGYGHYDPKIPHSLSLRDGGLVDSNGLLIEPSHIRDGEKVLSRGVDVAFRKEDGRLVGYVMSYADVRRLVPYRPQWGKTKTIKLDITPSSLPYLHVEQVGLDKFVRADLVKHLLRTDIELPQIYLNRKGLGLTRQALVALEAHATFSYLLPRVRVYHPTQILELREKIKDTREGFAMHLLKLSKGLDEHAKDAVSVNEVAKYATDIIQTELIPDYKEFQRQLQSIKAGTWKNFLDAAGKIAEIDAAPWTPKFWALLLKALGIAVIETEEEQKEKLSNKYQAFKFMGEIEKSGRRGL